MWYRRTYVLKKKKVKEEEKKRIGRVWERERDNKRLSEREMERKSEKKVRKRVKKNVCERERKGRVREKKWNKDIKGMREKKNESEIKS